MWIKQGDEVTAVYSGVASRVVSLMRVTKVGSKYLYGITLWVEPDGFIRDGHPTQANLETSVIYPGLRHDLRDAEFKYRKDYRQWKNRKQKKREDAQYELRSLVQDKVDEWETENPMPQPPEFPQPDLKAVI